MSDERAWARPSKGRARLLADGGGPFLWRCGGMWKDLKPKEQFNDYIRRGSV